MLSSLSDDTMFRRFLGSQKSFTEADIEEDHDERAIGEARYVTGSLGRVAETAVVIADEWQNLGLATALFSHLLAEAKRDGISKIIANFDLQNHSVIHIGQKFGFKLSVKEPRTDYSMLKAEINV